MECLENTCQDPIKDAGLGVKAMKRGWRQQPLLLHLASARPGQRGRSPGARDARGGAEPPPRPASARLPGGTGRTQHRLAHPPLLALQDLQTIHSIRSVLLESVNTSHAIITSAFLFEGRHSS